ncbi:fre family ferric-chelate reductase [Neofusicoccum parvum]|uniref:Fre family ferric-chelate reductase n=1 Tax=Neofusicoccum parvum TaxID=310453 RepID=A0ACB5RZ20_9PEZI|nr:fre family ferric-chelate reductase [Neofusicoccum parvum]
MLRLSSLFLAFALCTVRILAESFTPEVWSQYCFYAIYDPLDSLTWASDGSSKAKTQECTNVAVVSSIYASCKVYCSADQFDEGLEFWKELCHHGKSTLMDLSNISTTLTQSSINQLPVADPELNSTEQISEPVLLTQEYFERSYGSWKLKFESSPRSQRFGWAMDCFWGGLVLLGILKACIDVLTSRRASTTRFDAEKSGSVVNTSGKAFTPFTEASFWLKTHVFVPAAIGTRCQRMLLGCTIPQRSVSISIVAFWCLCIILGFSGYPTIANNTLTPNIHQYIWNAVAVRAGYMAYSLLPWVWMFAQRNNIFIWATGWSYATFSAFHRHCARAVTIFAIVHGISYSVVYAQYKHTYYTSLPKHWFQFGIVSVTLMALLVAFSVGYFRVHYYDSFLLMHIVFCIVLLYSLFFHTSKFTDGKYNIYLWPLVAIWSFDRLLRIARILYCNFRVSFSAKGAISCAQSATVRYEPSSDVIRITIQHRSSLNPGPGQYYHLYQPFVLRGWWENHPFSLGAYTTPSQPVPAPSANEAISAPPTAAEASKEAKAASSSITSSSGSSASPAAAATFTFWIRPYDGWTRRLRDACLAAPSRTTSPRLLVEGPYGHAQPLHAFDTVVMVVGGTGIAAATPYILDHAARAAAGATRTTRVRLVWTAKHAAFLRDVCRGELAGALAREDVEAVLFATGRGPAKAGEEEEEDAAAAAEAEDEIQPAGAAARREAAVRHERPDVTGIVAEAAREATEGEARTVVFVCGPAAMADEARAAVHAEMKKGCRRIEYVEDCFRW